MRPGAAYVTAPSGLRVEHLDEPLGLTTPAPRLSWQLPPGTRRQLGYRIVAGDWDSGRVTSPQSLLVPYAGPALRSGQRVDWTVRVWTDAGVSGWAPPGWWETGLLDPDAWTARWIGPPDPGPEPHPVWYLAGGCDLAAVPDRARLYVTAYGVYEFFVNGARVGDAELTPGFTSYGTRLQVQTYDVTALLRPGRNRLGAVLSGGWVGWAPLYAGLPLGLLAQLDATGPDGSTTLARTGADWRVATGPVRSAELRQGQVTDLRRDTGPWRAVAVRDVDPVRLSASPAPPVRRVEVLRPVATWRPRPDRQVVDFGQNLNGWVRLADLGPAGTRTTLLHGEALDAAGDVTVDHLWGAAAHERGPFQRDVVVSAGHPGDRYEPRHATHGFRYVRIEGRCAEVAADDVEAVVVHTDLRRTGWFECSDPRLDRLHEAVVWSLRGNVCDVPTDCPTRERAGWTGDWQVILPTAAYLYDVAGFGTKWLRDLAADQRPDGLVRHCAPEFLPLGMHVAANIPPGCAGFADAAVIVPWELYRAYGDRELLAEQWESMTSWVEYAAAVARHRRHPDRAARRPEPAPYEEFLWDTGFHWGEWREPDSPSDPAGERAFVAALATADHGSLATAYLHRSASLLARAAAVLGRDPARYAGLADATRYAWQQEFLRPDGTVTPDRQATYVRALAFGLVPEALRADATRHLVRAVRRAGTHLGTGFLATPYLLPVLADHGALDLAYELLLAETPPSWLAMLDRGATTMWEHWDGVDDHGVAHGSLNHYSKGAVATFLHRYVAGIRPVDGAPAYRRFRVEPCPGGGLTSARGVLDCPYGRIESAWRADGDRFDLAVTVPPGTSCTVRLPDGTAADLAPGRTELGCRLGSPRPVHASRSAS
ncbi:family 78 glycoside hydrolase catalytic domain [Actinocatenispora rupis]|nr:family 78 glycoside hydrolase catalytic domain [Actinocatenispora rupis]